MAPMKLNIRKHETIHRQLMRVLKELDIARATVDAEAVRSTADTLHLEKLLAMLQSANLILSAATQDLYETYKAS